jgi:hypothetical protein
MTSDTRTKLVLMEPGVPRGSLLAQTEGHCHVLLLGADESLASFRSRASRRVGSVRSTSRRLCEVEYVVGHHQEADWAGRLGLLSDLCIELESDACVAVVAPRSAVTDVLGCFGSLRAAHVGCPNLRAVFTDLQSAATTELLQ